MQEKCCEKCDLKKLSKTSTIPEYCMDIDCSCHKPQEKSVGEDWENKIDEEDFTYWCGNENHECECGVDKEKIKEFIRMLQKETEERVRTEMNTQLEETLKEIADYDLSAWRKIGIERGYWSYFEKETDDKWRKKIEETEIKLRKMRHYEIEEYSHDDALLNVGFNDCLDQATNIIKEMVK
jgi:hypothetical protein